MSTKKKTGGFDLSGGKYLEDNWLHLRHPALGHLLYVGSGAGPNGESNDARDVKPVRVKLRNADDAAVGKERQRLIASATAGSRRSEPTPEQEDEITKAVIKFCVLEFENVIDDGKPLDAKNEADRDFFLGQGDFIAQVAQFSTARSNFFVSGSKG